MHCDRENSCLLICSPNVCSKKIQSQQKPTSSLTQLAEACALFPLSADFPGALAGSWIECAASPTSEKNLTRSFSSLILDLSCA